MPTQVVGVHQVSLGRRWLAVYKLQHLHLGLLGLGAFCLVPLWLCFGVGGRRSSLSLGRWLRAFGCWLSFALGGFDRSLLA